MSDTSKEKINKAIGMVRSHGLHGTEVTIQSLTAERDALRAENERLRKYGQAVVDEYPVSAGTSPGLCGDESGYGSIYRLCTALKAKTPPG